ncbi:hypothetical protein P153DRAFT_271805, partial [Dothidotthia symphoricarpi CBS 119687]
TQLPTPPTTLASCAVPVGGSNTSILDACCNGHINAIATYSAPDSSSNSDSENGCFQYCVTNNPQAVKTCLSEKLGMYGESGPIFECFNMADVKTGGIGGGYSSVGVRLSIEGGSGWMLGAVLGIVVVATIMGAV